MATTETKATKKMTSGTRTTGVSMAKQSLAEACKGRVVAKTGYETWDVRLRQRNPKLMDQIDQWIIEWESGGGREFCPSRNSLATFIIERAEGYVCNPPAVVKYMERRANGKHSRGK
jgi:hypothetical protein